MKIVLHQLLTPLSLTALVTYIIYISKGIALENRGNTWLLEF